MRHLVLSLKAIFALLILNGCAGNTNEINESKEGTNKREVHEVQDFSRIALSGRGNLILHQGDRQAVELEAEENLLPYLTTQVTNGTLEIQEKPMGWLESFKSRSPFNAHVYFKNLESVHLSGKGTVSSENEIKSKNFTIKTSGSGKVDLTVESEELNTNIAGTSEYHLKGKTNNQNIQISGSGSYDASKLKSLNTSIDIAGAGKADVDVQNELNIVINGSGTVRYLGKPQISQTVFGNGKIEELKQ